MRMAQVGRLPPSPLRSWPPRRRPWGAQWRGRSLTAGSLWAPCHRTGSGPAKHNTHHILFLGSDNKLIDCFASVSTWKMMPAVPTSTATVKIQRKSLSRTWATYFQSSIIWTKTGCIVRGELSIMSSFSLFKRLQGLFVLMHCTYSHLFLLVFFCFCYEQNSIEGFVDLRTKMTRLTMSSGL